MSPPPSPSGERPLHGRPGTRRAAATWALTVLALGASAQSGMAAERSDSVLVRVDPSSSSAERADLGRALDAESVQPLVAGWRAYELAEDVSLAQARRLLAGEPAAASVQLDGRLFASETPDDTYFGAQWALPAIDAPTGWDAAAGAAEVIVAVVDTGVQTSHPDLAGRLWENPDEIAGNGLDDDGNGLVDDVAGWNFYDGTNAIYSPADGDSHGTHVAGTIAARRGNAQGVAGVADNARIMPLKFLKPGGGYTSDAILAIQYAVAKGARVINASWGGETYSQPLCDAIANAGEQGVLFVVAAGNGGPDAIGDDNDATPAWPANCPAPNIVAVAATTPGDGLATFSNFGAASVDLGAPGEGVLSTVPSLTYSYKSGTSMAAPHVSGVAAVVLGLHPGLVPWQLKAALTAGGDPAAALAGTTASGRRVDLVGALAVAGTGAGPDTTPPDAFGALAPADGFSTASPAATTFTWGPSADGQTGIAAYRLVIDGATVASVAPGVFGATPAALADGVHTWSVAAVDGAGNTRSTPPRVLTIDRAAPTAPAPLSPAAGARVEGPVVRLAWAASQDAVSGVASYRVLVDGVPVATLPASARSARVTMRRGTHSWQVVATDALGNAVAGAARGLTVTDAVPSLGTKRVVRRLTLIAPARLASGRAPALRVRLGAPARVTVTVRRAARPRPIARFRVRARAGVTSVRFPAAALRRMRARGTYVVAARASATLRDTVRITVGARPTARRLSLSAPARLASGAQPALRVRLAQAAGVTVTVRRADRSGQLGGFRVRARAGVTPLRVPRAVLRRMRPPGNYVVSARAAGIGADSVRITVAPRPR